MQFPLCLPCPKGIFVGFAVPFWSVAEHLQVLRTEKERLFPCGRNDK